MTVNCLSINYNPRKGQQSEFEHQGRLLCRQLQTRRQHLLLETVPLLLLLDLVPVVLLGFPAALAVGRHETQHLQCLLGDGDDLAGGFRDDVESEALG